MQTSTKVGVIGLAPTGANLASALARCGHRVLAFDADTDRTDCRAGVHRPAGVEVTDDLGRLAEADDLVLTTAVGQAVSGGPDVAAAVAMARLLGSRLRVGQMVVYTGGGLPGTLRQVILPALLAGGRLVEIPVACSPDHCDAATVGSGQARPRLVGGLDVTACERAVSLLDSLPGGVLAVSSPEVAEAAHLQEQAVRAVQVSLAEELKVLYGRMGMDGREVNTASSARGIDLSGLNAGEPVPDPYLLTWSARRVGAGVRLLDLAIELTAGQTERLLEQVADSLNGAGRPLRGSRVLLLGCRTDDAAEELIGLLRKKGALVSCHPPRPPEQSARSLTEEILALQDLVVILAANPDLHPVVIVRQAKCLLDPYDLLR
jgi:UDP-N-acetyl-D-glucosamine dehydrogenase